MDTRALNRHILLLLFEINCYKYGIISLRRVLRTLQYTMHFISRPINCKQYKLQKQLSVDH